MNSVSKSVLLIGNTKASSVASLLREAAAEGVLFDVLSPTEAIAAATTKSVTDDNSQARDIFSYDAYFFRGISGYISELQPLLQELLKRNKRVVEHFFAENGFLPEDKLVPASVKGQYMVPTSLVVEAEAVSTVLPIPHFPLVVKKLGIGSSMGKMVALVHTFEELQHFCATVSGPILLQEYHEIEYDTRVMVVGGKCLGGFDRHKLEPGDFITTRRGGSRDLTQLTPAQEVAAIEATELQGLAIAGVDMFMSNNKIYIIEVNSSPQFKVFERCTGVNVAKEIITYLLK